MGFFDNLNENLSDVKNNLDFLSKKLLSESKEIKRAARLKYEILNENRILTELYEKLGIHSYKLYKNEKSDLDVEKIIEEIEMHTSRVSSLKMGIDLNAKIDDENIYNKLKLNDEDIEDESSIIFIKEDDENK